MLAKKIRRELWCLQTPPARAFRLSRARRSHSKELCDCGMPAAACRVERAHLAMEEHGHPAKQVTADAQRRSDDAQGDQSLQSTHCRAAWRRERKRRAMRAALLRGKLVVWGGQKAGKSLNLSLLQ